MKSKLIISIILFFICQETYSQSISVSRMEVYMQVSPNDTTNLFGDTIFQSNTRLSGKMVLTLTDTLGISTLNVKLGSTQGSNNLFQKTFSFDVVGNFNDGTSYLRNGYVIHLGLGSFTGINSFFSEINLIDSSGNILDSKSYNMN